jgi:hypothetical protein
VTKPIQEVFREWEWEDLAQTRQARDQRADELNAQGYRCVCETLYTVWGHCVFVLTATPMESMKTVESAESKPPLILRSQGEERRASRLNTPSLLERKIKPPTGHHQQHDTAAH